MKNTRPLFKLLPIIFFLFVSIKADAAKMLSKIEKIKIFYFNIIGNSVFSDKELSEVIADYIGVEIKLEELENIRIKLTRFYIDRGYINSGAVIPEQDVTKGIVKILIIEGKITETKILGNKRLNKSYITNKLGSAIKKDKPFNIDRLEEKLKLLKQDRNIENINAEILPGLRLGEASLNIEIKEAAPYAVMFNYNDYGSPGIGEEQIETGITLYNLKKSGDSLNAKFTIAEGCGNYSFDYTIPFSNTAFSANYSEYTSRSTAYPFSMLDIESRTETLGCSLKHTFDKSLSRELAAGLKFEKSRNETFLLGFPFSFTAHNDDYETNAAVLDFFQEWIERDMNYVFAFRSDLKLGLNCLGATIHKEKDSDGKKYADSEYILWTAKLQYLKRISLFDSAFLFKSDLQLSNDSLLPAGKFSIGGVSSVRGYMKNFMTTDNGIAGSLEWRIPIIRLKDGIGQIEISPFLDYAEGWNYFEKLSEDIWSTGVELNWAVNKELHFTVYYGYGLTNIDDDKEKYIKDERVHFQMSLNIF